MWLWDPMTQLLDIRVWHMDTNVHKLVDCIQMSMLFACIGQAFRLAGKFKHLCLRTQTQVWVMVICGNWPIYFYIVIVYPLFSSLNEIFYAVLLKIVFVKILSPVNLQKKRLVIAFLSYGMSRKSSSYSVSPCNNRKYSKTFLKCRPNIFKFVFIDSNIMYNKLSAVIMFINRLSLNRNLPVSCGDLTDSGMFVSVSAAHKLIFFCKTRSTLLTEKYNYFNLSKVYVLSESLRWWCPMA